jgi:hypothetical protein
MTNIRKLSIALNSADVLDIIPNVSAVAIITSKQIPESYTFMQDVIIGDYRVSVYNMNTIGKSYALEIHGVGLFQVL